MKLKKLFIFLGTFILILGLSSCSKSGEKLSGKISFSVSSLVSGNFPGNGIVVNGSNGVNHFQLALSNPADDIIIELEPGNWSFKAIAWVSDGTVSPLHGVTTCAVTTSELTLGDFVITMNFNKPNCNAPTFGPASMKRTDDTTQFKELVLRPCLYYNGLSFTNPSSEKCYDTWKQKGMGTSYRVVIFSSNSVTGQRTPGIVSKCVDVNSTTDGVSDIHLPINSPSGSFPFVINSYEEKGCAGSVDSAYIVSSLGGSFPAAGIPKAETNINDTFDSLSVFLYFPDNFVGTGMTSLDTIQPEDPSKCGGASHCFDNENRLEGVPHMRFDSIRNDVFRVIGSPSGSDHIGPSHSAVQIDDGSGNGILVFKKVVGAVGGGGSIILSAGGISLNVDNTTDLDITSPLDIATLVTNINGSTNYSAVALDGSNEGATIPAGTYTLNAGSDTASSSDMKHGRSSLRSISEIFAGPVGATLYKEGLTTCGAVIGAVGNSYTVNDHLEGGQHVISIAGATQNMPTVYTTGGGSPFEGRIEITSSGGGDTGSEILEFNCTTTGNINQMGMYASSNSDAQGSHKEEVYYESTPTWANTKIEVLSYSTHDGKTHRNVTSFKGTTTDEFKMWTAHYTVESDATTHYERSYVSRTAAGIVEQKALGLDDINANSTFEFDATTGLLLLTPTAGVEEIKFEERSYAISPHYETTGFTTTAVEYQSGGAAFNSNAGAGHATLSYNFLISLETSLLLL